MHYLYVAYPCCCRKIRVVKTYRRCRMYIQRESTTSVMRLRLAQWCKCLHRVWTMGESTGVWCNKAFKIEFSKDAIFAKMENVVTSLLRFASTQPSCLFLTLSCRLGLAPARKRLSTTLWWPFMLACSSAVSPSCMLELTLKQMAQKLSRYFVIMRQQMSG